MEKIKNVVTYSDREINSILSIIIDSMGLDEGKSFKINQEFSDSCNDDDDYPELNGLFEPLIGFKLSYESDGDHRHDGQMVDYWFYFKNPDGGVTTIETEMCLMVGWDFYDDVTINLVGSSEG